MPQMLVPDPRFRSPTAVGGKSDFRDENIYSSILLQDSGAGIQKLFTVPQGQTIPSLQGAAAATTNAHQKTYTEATTNITKAGELGSGIGDAAFRALGITIEQAAFGNAAGSQSVATGIARGFGGTQYEVADITSKCFFQLRIANKPQIIGNVFMFPTLGGSSGSIGSTGNNITVGVTNNGWPGSIRRLKIPVPVARNDTVEGVFGVAGSASLQFSQANSAGANAGQPTLLWVVALANIAGDVR